MNNTTQQEILLFTGTGLSAREWCKIDDSEEGSRMPSEMERLADAIWNGLLPEMLPEICEEEDKKSLVLWQMTEAPTCLEIEMGLAPSEKDHYESIIPSLFLPLQNEN